MNKPRIYWAPEGAGGTEGDPGAPEGDGDPEGGTGGTPEGQESVEIAYLPQIAPDVREGLKGRLQKYPKITDLARAVIDQEDRLARAVVVPDMENPDPEELKAFRAALGLPAKPEEYDITLEGIDGGDEAAKALKAAAFKMGLSKAQAAKFGTVIARLATIGLSKQSEDRKKAAETFEARLLEAVDNDQAKRDETLNLFKRFLVKRMGDATVIKELAAAGLVHNPAFAVKAAEIERYFSDEPFAEGRPDATGAGGKQAKGTMGDYSPEFQERFGGKK